MDRLESGLVRRRRRSDSAGVLSGRGAFFPPAFPGLPEAAAAGASPAYHPSHGALPAGVASWCPCQRWVDESGVQSHPEESCSRAPPPSSSRVCRSSRVMFQLLLAFP